MPEKPVVFISCGQSTEEEIALGNQVERFIREKTPFEPYFAEQQNTLDGLVTNILSALGRSAAFIGIVHHRGRINTPAGETVIRGSVWIEQELAICAFVQHVLHRQLAVVLYLQRGISREGIRSQLRLKPVEFDNASDILSDLPNQIAQWTISPVFAAPLITRWDWKRLPRSTGERHEYQFSVHLQNNGSQLIDKWKVELWFPSSFIQSADRSQPHVYFNKADTDFSGDDNRIWPGTSKPVLTVPYFVTHANWPGRSRTPEQPLPKVRLRVSTATAQPWEEEISMVDIQNF